MPALYQGPDLNWHTAIRHGAEHPLPYFNTSFYVLYYDSKGHSGEDVRRLSAPLLPRSCGLFSASRCRLSFWGWCPHSIPTTYPARLLVPAARVGCLLSGQYPWPVTHPGIVPPGFPFFRTSWGQTTPSLCCLRVKYIWVKLLCPFPSKCKLKAWPHAWLPHQPFYFLITFNVLEWIFLCNIY